MSALLESFTAASPDFQTRFKQAEQAAASHYEQLVRKYESAFRKQAQRSEQAYREYHLPKNDMRSAMGLMAAGNPYHEPRGTRIGGRFARGPAAKPGSNGIWLPGADPGNSEELAFESFEPNGSWKAIRNDEGLWKFWTTDRFGHPHHEQVADRAGFPRSHETGFSGIGFTPAIGRRTAEMKPELDALLQRNRKAILDAMEMDSSLTAADGGVSPEIPTNLINEDQFKESVKARTLATRKRMVNEVAIGLLGKSLFEERANQELFAVLIERVAEVQSENAYLAASDAVHSAILEGLTDGLSVDQTAERIGEVMTEWAPWQAKRQAQTDLISLANGSSLTAAQVLGDEGPQFKTWLSAGDDKVRPAHRELNRSTVPIDGAWSYEGASLRYPGDPDGPDGLVINCRCSLIYTDTVPTALEHSANGGIFEDDKAVMAVAAAGNPYHEPRGTRVGGRFARGPVFQSDDFYHETEFPEELRKSGFSEERFGSGAGATFGQGVYLTDNPSGHYADSKVRTCVRLFRPFVGTVDEFRKWSTEEFPGNTHETFRDLALDHGYDGLVLQMDSGTRWVVSFRVENVDVLQASGNPYHHPAGTSIGGQFAPRPGTKIQAMADQAHESAAVKQEADGEVDAHTPSDLAMELDGRSEVLTDGPATEVLDEAFRGYGDTLTEEQKSVLLAYRTWIGSDALNSALRRGDLEVPPILLPHYLNDSGDIDIFTADQASAEEVVSLLDGVIEDAPSSPAGLSTTVYKGISRQQEIFGPDGPQVGEVYHDPAYVSTTTEFEVAAGRYTRDRDLPVSSSNPNAMVLEVHTPKGQKGFWMRTLGEDYDAGNRELLLPRGQSYRVIRVGNRPVSRWDDEVVPVAVLEVVPGGLTAATRVYDPALHPRWEACRREGGRWSPRSLQAPAARTLQDVIGAQEHVRVSGDEWPDGKLIALHSIQSNNRGKGYASQALDEIGAYADSTGSTVLLTPGQVGNGLTTDDLEAWYVRHGYRWEGEHMVRGPGLTAAALALISEAITAAAAVDHSASSMIALYPQIHEAEALAVENGQPVDDLHCTLAFLPDGVNVDQEELRSSLSALASMSSAMNGEIGGIGLFKEGEEGFRPVVALVDTPGLSEFRADLIELLDILGQSYAGNHGFTPHITLEYARELPGRQDREGIPVTFTGLSLVEGTERTDFPFAENLGFETLDRGVGVPAAPS